MPEFTGVSHVELTVRDPDRSAAWYARVLGMRKVAEYAEDDHPTAGVSARLVNLLHGRSALSIGLIRHASGTDEEFSELRVGLDHLALSVAGRDELQRWVEHLDACGVQHSGISDHSYSAMGDYEWSASVLVFRDPDNIQLELFVLSAG